MSASRFGHAAPLRPCRSRGTRTVARTKSERKQSRPRAPVAGPARPTRPSGQCSSPLSVPPAPPAEDGWWEARELRLGTSGQARVLVALRGAGESPAAVGEIALPLATNARWRLDVFASSADGPAACGDCTGFRRFAIAAAARPSAQDWLYVTWTSRAP